MKFRTTFSSTKRSAAAGSSKIAEGVALAASSPQVSFDSLLMNAATGHVNSGQNQMSGNATYQDLDLASSSPSSPPLFEKLQKTCV